MLAWSVLGNKRSYPKLQITFCTQYSNNESSISEYLERLAIDDLERLRPISDQIFDPSRADRFVEVLEDRVERFEAGHRGQLVFVRPPRLAEHVEVSCRYAGCPGRRLLLANFLQHFFGRRQTDTAVQGRKNEANLPVKQRERNHLQKQRYENLYSPQMVDKTVL